MADNYKLCPKCNNPLDLKETACPYCWESLSVFGWNQIKQNKPTVETKGCSWIAKILFIIFFVIPLISSAISFIAWLISWIFE